MVVVFDQNLELNSLLRNIHTTRWTTNNNTIDTIFLTDNKKSKVAVFYNTFSQTNHTELAVSIVEEQLQTISSQPLLDNTTIFYYRIGNFKDWPWLEDSCIDRGHTCIQIDKRQEGDEMLILQEMHDYCVKNEHDRVIYIHSKGSFHPSKINDKLRKILMRAVTSQECIEYQKDRCNVCGAQYAIHPFNSYVGNMFVADCSYVSMLIPPREFAAKKESLHNIVKNNTVKNGRWSVTHLTDNIAYKYNTATAQVFLDRISWTGLGRYAAEHWIGSHPDLRPCQVFSPMDGFKIIVYDREMPLFKYVTPTLRDSSNFTTEWIKDSLSNSIYHPYFTYLGRIWEYEMLYSKTPPNDGWFNRYWSHFDAQPFMV